MKYALKKLTVPHRVISLTAENEVEARLFNILKEDKINTLKIQHFEREILLLLPNACIRRWKRELGEKEKKEIKTDEGKE